MPHLILWKQAVGGGAGGHQEGQHVRPLQVHQEHVQQHIWHIKNIFNIMISSLRPSTRLIMRRTWLCSWWTCRGPSCCPSQCTPYGWSQWTYHDAYNVFDMPCLLLNMFLVDLYRSIMLSFSMSTCSSSYSLRPKYQVSHIKSTYYAWPNSFDDGPKALKCNLRIFISCQVTKCPEVSY